MKWPAAFSSFLFAFLLLVCGARAQTITAVSNGASFVQNSVSPGAIASIFGTNLASGTASASTVPLPKTLSGTTVTVNGVAAPLFYVSPIQINFQLPYETATGQASAVVSASSGNSAPFNFMVGAASPGILVFSTNRAVVQNPDSTINSANNPVAAGSYIVAYLTGIGPIDNAVPTGTLNPGSPLSMATQPFSATIGGATASVSFLGLTPGFVGLAQANIQVPSLQSGSYPLVITVGGVASNGPMITVVGGGVTQIGTLVTTSQGNAANVVVSGNIAYVCGNSAISIVDVSNAVAPKLLSSFGQGDLGGSGYQCRLYQNNLVETIGGQSGALYVYSLSNPTQPASLSGRVDIPPPFPGDLFFSGSTGFYATVWFHYTPGANQITDQHGDFFDYDFSNPAQPKFLTSLAPDASQPASSNLSPRFAAAGIDSQTAYIASTTSTGTDPNGGVARIEIIDISNPGNLRAVGQLLIPQATSLMGIAVNGTTALVAGNTKSWSSGNPAGLDYQGFITLTSLDITDPRNPKVISTIVTGIQSGGPTGTEWVVSLGNGLFAVNLGRPAFVNSAWNPLLLVDARDPRNIAGNTVGSAPALGGMFVVGNKLYAATGTGLNIYQIGQ